MSEQPAPEANSSANAASAARASRARGRRVTLSRVDPVSVFRMSLVLYAGLHIAFIAALVLLFVALSVLGALDSVQRILQDLFADTSFAVSFLWIVVRLLLLGFVGVALWAVVNFAIAHLYNAVAGIVGGVGVTLDDESSDAR